MPDESRIDEEERELEPSAEDEDDVELHGGGKKSGTPGGGYTPPFEGPQPS